MHRTVAAFYGVADEWRSTRHKNFDCNCWRKVVRAQRNAIRHRLRYPYVTWLNYIVCTPLMAVCSWNYLSSMNDTELKDLPIARWKGYACNSASWRKKLSLLYYDLLHTKAFDKAHKWGTFTTHKKLTLARLQPPHFAEYPLVGLTLRSECSWKKRAVKGRASQSQVVDTSLISFGCTLGASKHMRLIAPIRHEPKMILLYNPEISTTSAICLMWCCTSRSSSLKGKSPSNIIRTRLGNTSDFIHLRISANSRTSYHSWAREG